MPKIELWEREEREISPLNNPPQSREKRRRRCDYCEYTTTSEQMMVVHVNKYHEEVVAARGVKSVREGGGKFDRQRQQFLALGWSECQWSAGVPCPGPNSKRFWKYCEHRKECPGLREQGYVYVTVEEPPQQIDRTGVLVGTGR